MLIAIDAVIIGSGRRRTTKENVANLVKSITLIGLQTPISVLPADKDGKYPLVAGRNRLEACGKLGHLEIEAKVIKDKVAAELWEIAENLHRAELTAMQRNLNIGRWIKLTAKMLAKEQKAKPAVQLGPLGHKQQPGGISGAARELGISETTAKRAVKVATELTKSAQREAEKLGLDNNQRALERAAGVPGAEEQIRSLHRTVAAQQQRQEMKEQIKQNHQAAASPKTGKDIFDHWFRALDIDQQALVRIWLLGHAEDYFTERENLENLLRADLQALH